MTKRMIIGELIFKNRKMNRRNQQHRFGWPSFIAPLLNASLLVLGVAGLVRLAELGTESCHFLLKWQLSIGRPGRLTTSSNASHPARGIHRRGVAARPGHRWSQRLLRQRPPSGRSFWADRLGSGNDCRFRVAVEMGSTYCSPGHHRRRAGCCQD